MLRSAAAIRHASTPPDPGPESSPPAAKSSLLCCSSAFSACIILVNASHDRLAHNQGPCYRATAAAHRTDRSSGPIARCQRALSHMHDKPAPTSPHAHTCTSALQVPLRIYMVCSAFGGHCIACPCSHGVQLAHAVRP
jgi:hypothetical protein